MAKKADFSPDQWRRFIEAPLLAGFAVSAAAPGGLIGMIQESMASADALASAQADAAANELVAAIIEDLLTAPGRTAAREGVQRLIEGAELAEIKARSLAQLRETARIADAAAPQDAAALRNWLAGIARRVAGAAAEGGFLGLGGEQISRAERAALDEIDAALGL